MRRKLIRVLILLGGLALVVSACGVLFLKSRSGREWLSDKIASSLSNAIHRVVVLRVSSIELLGPAFEIEEFRIAGPGPEDEDFILAREISATSAWSSVLRRRVDLKELSIGAFELDIDKAPGSDPVKPKREQPYTTGDLLRAGRVGRLQLDDGRVVLGDKTLPVSFDADDIRLSAAYTPVDRGYDGQLSIDAGQLAIRSGFETPLSLQTEFHLDEKGVEFNDVRATSPSANIEGTFSLFNPPRYHFRSDLKGTIDLENLPDTLQDRVQGSGIVTVGGYVEDRGSGVEYEFQMNSPALRTQWIPLTNAQASVKGSGDGIRFEDARFFASGCEVSGAIRLGPAPGFLPWSVRAKVVKNNDTTSAEYVDATLPLRGSILAELDLEGTTFEFETTRGEVSLVTEKLTLDGIPAGGLESRIVGRLDGERFDVDELLLGIRQSTLHAIGSFSRNAPSSVRVNAGLSRVESIISDMELAARKLGLVFVVPARLKGARGDLRVETEVTAPKGLDSKLKNVTASGNVQAVNLEIPSLLDLPLNLDFQGSYSNETAKVDSAELRSEVFALGASGKASGDGAEKLEIRFETGEPSRFSQTVVHLMRQLRPQTTYSGLPEDTRGTVGLSVALDGPWRELSVSGDLGVDDFAVGNQEFGDLRATVVSDGTAWQFSGDARSLESGLEFQGQWAGGYGSNLPSYLSLRLFDQPLESLLTLANISAPISGDIEGDVTLDLDTFGGTGWVTLRSGSLSGFPVHSLEADFAVTREMLDVICGHAAIDGGDLKFAGRLDQTGAAGLLFTGTGFDLGRVAEFYGAGQALAGSMDVEAWLTGAWNDPSLEVSLLLRGLSSHGQAIPDLRGNLQANREKVTAELLSDMRDHRLWAQLGFGTDDPWVAEIDLPFRIDTRHIFDLDEETPSLTAEGRVTSSFYAEDLSLSSLNGQLRVYDLLLSGSAYEVRAGSPIALHISEGRLNLDPFQLSGEGTTLSAEGTLSLETPPSIHAEAQGTIDLRLLQGFTSGLRTEGIAEVDLDLIGPLQSPGWTGSIQTEDSRVRYAGFPAALENIRASFDLTPEEWSLTRFEANFGGGNLEATGRFSMNGLSVDEYQIGLTGQGMRLTYPTGFRSESDLAWRLERIKDGQDRLTGRIELARALYESDFRIEEQVLSRTRKFGSSTSLDGGILDRLLLDLEVRADNGLWLRNNLVSMEARAELRATGTVGRPELAGRIEVMEGGTLTFRKVPYHITRGSLDFLGGVDLRPLLDIQAETTVSQYDILLSVTGPPENLKFELSSSPPLAQTDIVSLLVAGATREELAASRGGLSESDATAYLSGKLTGSVESALEKTLGLDELTIDPVLVEGQTNPAARVTVGKALSARLYATYSSELGSGKEDLYRLQYRLTDHLSLMGTRDVDGSLSSSLRFGTRFYLGPDRRLGETISSGEQQRISRIEISGLAIGRERKVRRLLKLDEGSLLRRAVLLDGLDRIRKWYLENRYPEARLDYSLKQEDERVAIEIQINEGRKVLPQFPGAPFTRGLEKKVLEAWGVGVFSDEVLEDSASLVADTVRFKGYPDVQVEPTLREIELGAVVAEFRLNSGPRVRVRELRVAGVHSLAEEDVRAQILTRTHGFLRRGWLIGSRLEEDRKAIQGLYLGRGYLKAQVDYSTEPAGSDDSVSVLFTVDEGPQYRVGVFSFASIAAFKEAELKKVSGLVSGDGFVDDAIRLAQTRLRSFYDDRGYHAFRLEPVFSVDHDSSTVDVEFVITEGPSFTIRSIQFTGNRLTRRSVLLRQLEVQEGDPLSTEGLNRSRYNLYRTGLFKSVHINTVPSPIEGFMDVLFELEEGSNLILDSGVGYDSEEGLRLSGNLAHLNIMGRRLYAGAGGRWSTVDRRVHLTLRQPRLGGSRLEGLVTTFWEAEERESFEVRRKGVSFQISRELRDRNLRLMAGYKLQDLDIFQGGMEVGSDATVGDELFDSVLEDRESAVRLGSFQGGLLFDTRDAYFWPSRGNQIRGEVGLYSSLWASEADFVQGFFQWTVHAPVIPRVIWGSSVRMGFAEPLSDTRLIPISERFFLGGENSLRGFKFDSVFPEGLPESVAAAFGRDKSPGGNGIFVVNQEVVVPLWSSLYGVLFYDAGNLYWKTGDFDPLELRHAAGLGVRLKTPVGPFRLEYGRKLDKKKDESPGRWHFSFGLSF